MTRAKGKRPAKRRASKRADDRDVDAVIGQALSFLAGAAFGKVQPADAAATCAACGHARRDHCGCGKTCCWTGPEQVMPDGRRERALCSCGGFTAASPAPEAFCGGALTPLLDLLGLGKKP